MDTLWLAGEGEIWGVFLWVQALINILPGLLQWCKQYRVILNRVSYNDSSLYTTTPNSLLYRSYKMAEYNHVFRSKSRQTHYLLVFIFFIITGQNTQSSLISQNQASEIKSYFIWVWNDLRSAVLMTIQHWDNTGLYFLRCGNGGCTFTPRILW